MCNNILIVDDSMVDRTMIKMILNNTVEDIMIVESEDGVGINDLIVKNKIKVCILDLRMPHVSGYDILSEIKSDGRIMDVPVIVCSGILNTEALIKVLASGAYDYFSKPLSDEAMKVLLPLKVKNAIELMKRTEHIVHLSQIDALTGLYNRAEFKKVLKNYSYDTWPNSIVMLDINGLKIANDAYGNDLGDQFLVALSKTITINTPSDAICSRWGGDEFAVFLPNSDKGLAEKIAVSIKDAFSNLCINGLTLSLAAGWEVQLEKTDDLSKTLIKAEDAMIRSKILEDVSIRSNLINGILNTLHEKNQREEAHSRRVSELCEKMGKALNLSDKEVHDLKVIGLVHDIGKIAIDINILDKPGRLNHDEWLEIKRHPEIGFRILSSSPELQDYADVILCHHERLDGKGYPNGLVGNQIHFFSRILSIADSYDAMTRERTYKTTLTDVEAALEFQRNKDTQFDAKLVDVFITKVLGLPMALK